MTESFALSTQHAAVQARDLATRGTAETKAGAADAGLAKSITKKASIQTYMTIRLLADREYADTAYRLYAYFRWVDDILDEELSSGAERLAFLHRQQMIVERGYSGKAAVDLSPEEQLAADLIAGDPNPESGLGLYMREMMAVMAFDAERKGRSISALELHAYTGSLATAVTEALHYCIGHDCYAPQDERRYHAVRAAHITHMLRDAVDDTANGYVNIPLEYLQTHGIEADDFGSEAYRSWVKARVRLARKLFASGKTAIAQMESSRCRLAGYAYIARFEAILDLIEKDRFSLREAYPERKSKGTMLRMAVGTWKQISNNN